MKIENTVIFGWESAIRGMRNPRGSWHRSDSTFWKDNRYSNKSISVPEIPFLGPNDLELALKLVKAGTEHRKFLRQIMIWADITLPRYIWQELDTYKIGTVKNSCSSMYGTIEFLADNFEDKFVMPEVLEKLNQLNQIYKDKHLSNILIAIKRLLPEGYLQKATYSFNYETALSMFIQRSKHRLKEWSGPEGICNWIKSFPYMETFLEKVI